LHDTQKFNALPEEREMHLSQTDANHSEWEVFTDSPYWMRRLDKVATPYKVVGNGRLYRLQASQVTIRALPKPLSEAERKRRADRLRETLSAKLGA
jgi:hypothetical protein